MWHAQPRKGFPIDSNEAKENMAEIYNQLKSTWSIEAIGGMLGNLYAESGLNPWRWQSDKVSMSDRYKGYGLCQFTPAYGYINDYGVGVDGYAPNMSTTEVTSGANASDGKAQIIVIDTDRAGKFINRKKYCDYADLSGCYPMDSFKQVNDLYIACVGWLFNYEFPKDRSESVANLRYEYAQTCYEYIKTLETPTPEPPTPPTPPEPPTPVEENLLDKIKETSYNIKQIGAEQQTLLSTIKIGDIAKLRTCYDRNKQRFGQTSFSTHVRITQSAYKIIGVRKNGFVELKTNSENANAIYINPKYIKKGE